MFIALPCLRFQNNNLYVIDPDSYRLQQYSKVLGKRKKRNEGRDNRVFNHLRLFTPTEVKTAERMALG